MAATRLKEAFLHLSQHSVDSVQNGKSFTEWDDYMHVDRPIENKLYEKMDEIDNAGGGIVLLVGSAGDGKSHLLSRIRQMSDWGDNSFYNDATASSSPKKTAIDTLKEEKVNEIIEYANTHEKTIYNKENTLVKAARIRIRISKNKTAEKVIQTHLLSKRIISHSHMNVNNIQIGMTSASTFSCLLLVFDRLIC